MRDLQRLATPVIVCSATAFIGVLFLDWWQVTVATGPVHVQAGGWGWTGAGAAAGVLAIALLVGEALRDRYHRRGAEIALAVSAVGVLILTLSAFFNDGVEVDVAGVVSAHVGQRIWPAYVGLVLACLLAAAALIRALPEIRHEVPKLLHPGVS
jgi:hypothetical protein